MTGAASDTLEIVVDASVRFQRFDGWGTSLAWWANLLGRLPADTRRDVVADVFSLENDGLGLTAVRFNLGAGENPALAQTMEPRARMAPWDPSMREASDPAQQALLDDAVRMLAASDAPPRFETFANSPPWQMTVSGTVTGASSSDHMPTDNLREDRIEQFAEWLVASTRKLELDHGIKVETISPFNEPSARWWRAGGRQEGASYSRPLMRRVLEQLARRLTRSHTGVVAPEEWSLLESVRTLDAFGGKTLGMLSAINIHGYDGDQRTVVRAQAAEAHLPLRMSEYGDADGSGLTLSRQILRDLRELRAERWVHWQAAATDSWGLVRFDERAGQRIRTRKYWAAAHFSRFLRPGARVVATSHPGSVATVGPEEGNLAVVVLNDGAESRRVRLVSGSTAVRCAVVTSLSTDDEPFDALATQTDDGGVGFVLPARSICSLRLDTTTPSAGRPPSLAFVGGLVTLVHEVTGLPLSVPDLGIGEAPGLPATLDATGETAFSMEPCGDGTMRLVSERTGLQLDIAHGDIRAGAAVIQWWPSEADRTTRNARWQVLPDAPGCFRLVTAEGGLALAPASVERGAPLTLTEDPGVTSRWVIRPRQVRLSAG